MVTSPRYYAKSISQTDSNTVWNKTNPQNPKKYREFVNLEALKNDDNSYAVCSNLAGKNGTHNRPSTITFKNFGIKLPNNIKIIRVIVGYAHNKISYSSSTAYPTISNPTISLMNVSGSGKGNAVPIKYTKYTKSFTVNTTRDKVTSSNFGVKINYPVNTSKNTAGMKLGYCWVQIVYEEITKKISGSVLDTSSVNNSIDEIVKINSSVKSIYQNDSFNLNLSVSTNMESTASLKYQLKLDTNFRFKSKIAGDGLITVGDDGNLYWEFNTANKNAGIEFSLVAVNKGTHYIICNDVTDDNVRMVKKFGIVVLEEQTTVYSNFHHYGTENETIKYTLDVFTTSTEDTEKQLKIEFPQEIIIEAFETENGDYTLGSSSVQWNARFAQQRATASITVTLTSSGIYSQTITDTATSHILDSKSILVKPENLSVPFFSTTEIKDEIYDRLGEGITYKAVCYMKIDIEDNKDTEADERDLFVPYEHNYRFGVSQENIEDENEFLDKCSWSEQITQIGEWVKLEASFTFDNQKPLYLVRTGEYIENQTTYIQVYFTEAQIIESRFYNGLEPVGNYPEPIKALNSPIGYSVFNMKTLENTSPVRLYNLDSDELMFNNIVIEGITVYFDINCNNSTNLLCNLILPNGKKGHRSINIPKTDGTVTLGGEFDLWGLDFNDFELEILDDIEIEIIAQNPYVYDSVLEMANIKIQYHFLELEDDYIEFWINDVSSKYYNIFLSDVEGVSGANNKVSYYQVTGSDNIIAYQSNIESKELKLDFYIGSCTIEEATMFLQRASRFFANKRNTYNKPILNKIRFAHIPDIYYEYVQEKAIQEKIETGEYKCSITLKIPDGTAYSTDEVLAISTGSNNGIAKVSPTIQLLALKNEIKLTEKETNQSFYIRATGKNDIAVNDIVVIECASQKLTKNTPLNDGTYSTFDITDHVDFDSDWFVVDGEFDFNAGETALIQSVRFRERW